MIIEAIFTITVTSTLLLIGPSLTVPMLLSTMLSICSIFCSSLPPLVALSSPAITVFMLSSVWALFVLISLGSERSSERLLKVCAASCVSSVSGLMLVVSSTTVSSILSFELMMFSALFLLRLTAKTDRAEEALVEMAVWALIGSFFLLTPVIISPTTSLSSASDFTLMTSIFLVLGFAIKVPLWPFTSWLLKAHVEASTDFSIFLSGLLVKFGVWGLITTISMSSNQYALTAVQLLALIGLLEAFFRLSAQVDVKRVIALLTVIETNWTMICLSLSSYSMNLVGTLLILAHCLTTTIEFSLVELFYKRSHSRSLLNIMGFSNSTPKLSKLTWASALITIGLPGTSIFFLKFVFLVELVSLNTALAIILACLLLVFLPVFLISMWVRILAGQSSPVVKINDVSAFEAVPVIVASALSLLLGFNPDFVF